MTIKKPALYVGKDLEAMSFAEKYHQWILDEFRPYLQGDVAEVGAGSGNFTSLLAATKTIDSLTSFEPSENMYNILCERVKQYERVTAVNGYFAQGLDDRNHYDAVVYVNVLEHIEKDLDELKFVRDSLNPRGVLCIFVPALSWLYSDLDREVGHFRRYHKEPLKSLVEDAGFEIIKIKYFDMFGVIPWYILFVLFNKTISGSNVSLYDKWVVPVIRKIESLISPPLGKNLLLVCTKPK
jgi:SAM-dependent methyltransferase